MAPSALERAIKKRDALKLEYGQLRLKAGRGPYTVVSIDYLLGKLETVTIELKENFGHIIAISDAADIPTHETEFTESLDQIGEAEIHLKEERANLVPVSSGSTSASTARSSSVKLPKLEIPNFDGKFDEWTSFRDLFSATIISNSSISGAQRLQYLKTSLKGDAANIVKAFTITDANFDEAWKLVKDRYDNNREIVFSIVRRLFSFPQLKAENVSQLRKFLDNCLECIRSLTVLKRPVEHWDDFLVCILVEKLDPDTRREWAKSLTGTDLPKFSDFMKFLESHLRGLQAGISSTKGQFTQHSNQGHSSTDKKLSHHVASSSSISCVMCKENHLIYKCPKFTSLSVQERMQVVKSKKLCFKCLSCRHGVRDCKSKLKCVACGSFKHNTLLHFERSSASVDVVEPNSNVSNQNMAVTSLQVSSNKSVRVLLSTAIVKVRDSCNQFKFCRVLLDPASESSFITDKCVKQLGLKRHSCNVNIEGIASSSVGKAKAEVKLLLVSRLNGFELNVDALVLTKVTRRLPSFEFEVGKWDHLDGLKLADPDYFIPREIDILLGADVTGIVRLGGKRVGPGLSPIAEETEFGWTLSGKLEANPPERSVQVNHVQIEPDLFLQKFWELEEVPNRTQFSEEEKLAEQHFVENHTRRPNGQYVVKLPFKNIGRLGLSREIAVRRFLHTERRLSKLSEKPQYMEFMREYEELGHMDLVPAVEYGEFIGKTNYLPHHFVLKESTTTRLRVVFVGSAKTTSGHSLNNCLLVGPTIHDDLFSILLRFRLKPIVLKADITKFFRMFQVATKDCDLQRILWRESSDQPIKEYRLKTVTYGTSSAPFLASRCLRQLVLDEGKDFPLAAAVALKDFYVDDLITGCQSTEEAVQLQLELRELISRGNMEIRKWDSNDANVLSHIPGELCDTNGTVKMDKFSTALGVGWDSKNDVLLFSGCKSRILERVTKRNVLSEMSRVFDPLGLLAPFTVMIKVFFQSLWSPIVGFGGRVSKLGWDEELADNLKPTWIEYQKGVSLLSQINIPRCILTQEVKNYEIHGFSDASERAYSAAVYLRCFLEDGSIRSRLLVAKTKVAPLNQVSLPRLELCGSLLLARLISSVTAATGINCPIYAWTDSEIVLRWLSSSSRRWKTFIANRVSEIQELIPSECWRHVPSEQNPADCASRGLTVSELLHFNLWWLGPDWLRNEVLPVYQINSEFNAKQLEEKGTPVLSHQVSVQICICDRFSSLIKLKRILAYVLRFVFNSRCKGFQRRTGYLKVFELNESFLRCVRIVQQQEFSLEFKCLSKNKVIPKSSRVSNLYPFVDKNGHLRVGGRIQHSNLSDANKHQLILPSSNHFVNLVIQHFHLIHHHAGLKLLLSLLQREFWILRGRDSVRHIIRKCVVCRKAKASTIEQLMGSLPAPRVTPSKPFQHTGLDYAGPFVTQEYKGRGKKQFKSYFCVFVCFSTKAVHLEAVSDLTTESFINTLKRFVSRRGVPTDLYSDCGSNFLGAEKELERWVKGLKHNQNVSSFLVDRSVQWHFNAPSSPHHGGLWEAGVKSVKYHLKRIVGPATLTLEEFNTILCQIESALNSRPLCALSSDPDDYDVLTPGHFLIGQPLCGIPEPDLSDVKINRLSRWQRSQQIFQHLWNRWSSEYMQSLQQRYRWKTQSNNIKVGDLVLIKDDNLPPMKWRLGRVKVAHPGRDNLVRIVTVKTTSGEFQRPIVKLCPLLSVDDLK